MLMKQKIKRNKIIYFCWFLKYETFYKKSEIKIKFIFNINRGLILKVIAYKKI